MRQGTKGGMKNLEFIDQQIQACKNAIELRKKVLLFSAKKLWAVISARVQ